VQSHCIVLGSRGVQRALSVETFALRRRERKVTSVTRAITGQYRYLLGTAGAPDFPQF
jgi:hypothetical protein